ncbi:hypothetical protein [Pseudomonas sp. MN1F]|uniref:hypothetical protein n=1 Tax=Pseudomonas sp. MN1F TaxID=1366632 RepID=UPI00128F80A1|nr:hypothetical protein [Pseudomonas sp. MN1F]MQG92059.1 hypothetical protein [Pseudomonas sp. MN1F]
MAVSVVELDVSEQHLAGQMVSPTVPPSFWKVIDGTEVYCVCTTEEHASAIAGVLKQKRVQDYLATVRVDFDKGLTHELDRHGGIRARCAHPSIQRYAMNAWDVLALESGKSIK